MGTNITHKDSLCNLQQMLSGSVRINQALLQMLIKEEFYVIQKNWDTVISEISAYFRRP